MERAVEDLRRHEVRRAPALGQSAVAAELLGQAEVDQAHRVVGSDHDVIGLDVAVDDVERVAVVDGLEEALHVAGGGSFPEALVRLGGDLLGQRGASDVLHDHVDVLDIVVSLIVTYNIGVVERLKGSDLLLHAVDVLRKSDFVDDLDGNLEVGIVLVSSKEYLAEGALAE